MYQIKDEAKLPRKLELNDENQSTFWVIKKTSDNAKVIYDFLRRRYEDTNELKGYSLSRLAKATKIDNRQVMVAVLIYTCKKNPVFRIESDLTPGKKPRKLVYLCLNGKTAPRMHAQDS